MDKTFEEKWESSDVQNIMNKVANRYRTAIDFDDLESIKMQTLWRCIDRYDPDKGTKFTSYLGGYSASWARLAWGNPYLKIL